MLPLAASAHYGTLAGTFMMLDFPLHNRAVPGPSAVYCESLTGALYLDRPAEIAAYERVWSSLDGFALDERQSRQPISKTIGEVYLTRAQWRKSTRSGDNNGACVEVADNLPGFVAVRDNKDPAGPALAFSPAA